MKRILKTLTLTIILIVITAFEARADNMLEYMDATDDLIRTGEYEEALTRIIWFHNHSIEHQKSIAGTRLSFALSDWYKFGKVYPQAMDALINTRNKKTALILTGSGSYDLFEDVSAINVVLSENHKTIALFEKLEILQPSLAKECWNIVNNIAVKEKNYTLLKKYSTNVLAEYSDAEELFKFKLERYKGDDEFIRMSENIFIERVLELIGIASSFNDDEAALLMRNKASKLVEDPRFKSVTIQSN